LLMRFVYQLNISGYCLTLLLTAKRNQGLAFENTSTELIQVV